MNKVFVYGTLKSGMPNHSLMTDDGKSKKYFDDAIVRGRLYSLGNYPAVVLTEPGYTMGEVWEVSDETLMMLDQLEEHPNFYIRQKAGLVDTCKWQVWVYGLPKDRLPAKAVPMPVGNWLTR